MRHKWNIKNARRWDSAFCVRCGLIKEVSAEGKLFYFKEDSTFYEAGECPGVQTFNLLPSSEQEPERSIATEDAQGENPDNQK